MNKFYWKKYKDTSDLKKLKKEILIELYHEANQAIRNNNLKRAAFLKREIEKIENAVVK